MTKERQERNRRNSERLSEIIVWSIQNHDLWLRLCFGDTDPVSYTHLVRVYSQKSGRGLRMDFEGFDYFGIWSSSADAPLICLEPWTGTATGDSEGDVFEQKRGMRLLPPGEEAEYAFTVTVF